MNIYKRFVQENLKAFENCFSSIFREMSTGIHVLFNYKLLYKKFELSDFLRLSLILNNSICINRQNGSYFGRNFYRISLHYFKQSLEKHFTSCDLKKHSTQINDYSETSCRFWGNLFKT